MMKYIPTLTIAGSDSGGGAGIQADIKTMSALGCYACSAITSITVQNTLGVSAVEAVAPEIVEGQIRAVMEDIAPRYIKLGMVNDVATIGAVARALRVADYDEFVVDPVMVSSSGRNLMQPEALDMFVSELLPLSTLVTPNLPEAAVLSGLSESADVELMAERILGLGCRSVLIKGGHMDGPSKKDVLFSGGSCYTYECPFVETRNSHGTGCTLSSAIISFLARGENVDVAVGHAKEYITKALIAGADVVIGRGTGPVNHFFDGRCRLIKRPG